MIVYRSFVLLLTGLLPGCIGDRLNYSEIIITVPNRSSTACASVSELGKTLEPVLVGAGFQLAAEGGGAEVWRWRDPSDPPGLSVQIRRTEEGGVVRLDQGLFGPMGPTAKYKRVKNDLIETLRGVCGPESVAVK